MTTSVKFSASVQSFTAKFNTTTNKIDLTFTEPAEVTNGSLPKPALYYIGYKEGNFSSFVLPGDNYFEQYQLIYVGQSLKIPSNSTSATYSWTPPNNNTTFSFGIWPVFNFNNENFDGIIKLLTYNKEVISDKPVLYSQDIDYNDGNLYIRNGYKINDTVDEHSGPTVISKLNNEYVFNNVSVKDTNVLSSIINKGPICYNHFNNKTYIHNYVNLSVFDNATNTFNNFRIFETGYQFIDSYATDMFYKDSEWIYFSNANAAQYSMPGLFKFKNNITSIGKNRTVNVTSVELLETITGYSDGEGDLRKYKIYTSDTSDFEVGRVISRSVVGSFFPSTVVIEVVANSYVIVLHRGGFVLEGTGNITYRFFSIYLVSGNLTSNQNLNLLPSGVWYNQEIGKTVSKGFYLNNEYYYMRNNNNDTQDFVKINLTTGVITLIGVNTVNKYIDVVYNINDGYAYAITAGTGTTNPAKIYRKNISTNSTDFIVDVPVVRSVNRALAMEIDENNNIFILISVVTPNNATDISLIYVYNTVTEELFLINYIQEQPTEEENTSDGDGDVTDEAGSGNSIGIGDYTVEIPEVGSPTVGPIEDPEGNPISPIIPIEGAKPGDIITFRKNGNSFYLLLNGKIIWTYLIPPLEMIKFSSTTYRGWYAKGTKTPIETPEENIIIRTFPLTYILNAIITEPSYSKDALFDGGTIKLGQTLVVFEDGSLYIDRYSSDEDIKVADYVVYSGRNYTVAPNVIKPSPILPRYIADLIGQTDYYIYLEPINLEEL
jgi:hypothetical protein